VDGDDDLGFDQFDCPQCVVRPHSKVVADGQSGQVNPFLANETHAVEECGVAGQVDFLALGGQQQPAGGAAA
jgi:hypothetical protein